MRTTSKLAIAAAIAGLAGIAALPVDAAPFLNGTVAIGDTSGAITHIPAGQLITSATSATFADTDLDGDGDVNVNSSTGTFLPLQTGDQVDINTAQFDFTALGTKTFDFFENLTRPTMDGLIFTATTFNKLIGPNAIPNFQVTIFGNGFWHDTTGQWADTAGAYTVSFTQTTEQADPNAAVSFSGTLSAFNRTTVPEPGTLLLLGFGLAGLAVGRRKS